MRKILFAVVLAILIGQPSFAADIYVSTSGNDTTGTGSISTPYRTVQKAITVSVSGDTIIVRGGTYTDSTSVNVDGITHLYNINATGKTNLTIRAYTGETPVFNSGGTINGCIVARSTATGLIVDGLTCSGHICGTEAAATGIVRVHGVSGTRWRNITLSGIATPSRAGEFSCGAFRLTGSGSGNTIIENNTMSGSMGHAILLENHIGSSGVIVRNNTINFDTASHSYDPFRTFAVKGSVTNTPVAFYNNRVNHSAQLDATHAFLFMRETPPSATVYAFNNICVNCGRSGYHIYTQDNSCPAGGSFTEQDVWVFNNTLTGNGEGVDWQNWWSSMRVVNNIFDGANPGVFGQTSASENCSHGTGSDRLWSTSTDKFTYNVIENSPGAIFGGIASGSVIDSTGTTISSSQVTQRDANNYLTAVTGVATNNPLGQGAGICSITIAGEVINCSADINGTSRGLSWDLGADQYASGQQAIRSILQGVKVTGVVVR